MLEKIGLPAKPSQRGNNWVADASHCQGCSSQFTFINRKHHCRRCGGLFCNSCTQQRMVLRGQGDSLVRICDPCKKIEEATRFEMRYGHKNRGGRGNSKLSSKYDEDDLRRILGQDKRDSLSLGQEFGNSSRSDALEIEASEEGCFSSGSSKVGDPNDKNIASNPEELRQQALDEKKKYKSLKAEGKSEEALKAFKRGKELERQADALELYLRKSRKKVSSSRNVAETLSKEFAAEPSRKNKPSSHVGHEKDDLTAELRELGWSDMDLRDDGKRVAGLSLEGELSNILGEVSQKTGKSKSSHSGDKSGVLAHKKRALMLKREGKLTEAKEELKKAKLLEKRLEEQEILGEAEDSDDEISALIRSMDSDDEDAISVGLDQDLHFDIERMLGFDDNQVFDNKFETTDEDMEDREIADALKSFGWTEESNDTENTVLKPVFIDREALVNEILSLKREAVNQKRAGNVSEAMTQLNRAKLLEKDLQNLDAQGRNPIANTHEELQMGAVSVDEKEAEINRLEEKLNAKEKKEAKLTGSVKHEQNYDVAAKAILQENGGPSKQESDKVGVQESGGDAPNEQGEKPKKFFLAPWTGPAKRQTPGLDFWSWAPPADSKRVSGNVNDPQAARGNAEAQKLEESEKNKVDEEKKCADLDDIRQRVGVKDPYWTPPTEWKPGGGEGSAGIFFHE